MRASRIATVVAVGIALAAGMSTGEPAAGSKRDIAPFTYTFRVVDFSMTATLTYAGARATIRYRLLRPSVPKTIFYLGSRPTNRAAAWKGPYAGPIVDVAAEATYTSLDPSCTSKLEYRPSGNKVVQVYVELAPRIGAKRVTASVRRIPLAEPHPEQDGTAPDFTTKPRPKCGKAVMGDWYQDMEAAASPGLLPKARVTVAGGDGERFTDPGVESIAWTMKVVLQRLSYREVDCTTHPGC